MGLDITAYSGLVHHGTYADYDEAETIENDIGGLMLCPDQYKPERLAPFPPPADFDVYNYKDSFGFRAGSYSGYNHFREWLSQSFLGVLPEVVWQNPSAYESKPFFELIDFSDCEGCLGTEASKRLFKAFSDNLAEAEKLLRSEQWELKSYKSWLKAFELASDNGLVEFH